ncbi:transcriptional regulator domain-containing protein [Parasphingorhabdus sp. DH2-15]|uniref:transcriptional regulator domain-containing protein n=1 Tax=Parasphingorhabdus sp. DH2-15 TaxID=3444112 RepID=UPI003F685AF4
MSKVGQSKAPDRMPNAAWAWEFLRRNEDYRRDFRLSHAGLPAPVALTSGATLFRSRRTIPEAEQWGLLAFADPDKQAIDANVFWRPDIVAGAVRVRLTHMPVDDVPIDEMSDIIVLSALKTRRIILDTCDGTRHIVLNGRRFWIQLFCDNDAPVGEFTEVDIRLDGAKHLGRRLDTATQLLSLHRSTGGKLSLIGRRQNSNALSNAIIAHDIWNGFERVKGSMKDIADATFGAVRVNADWGQNDRAMKAQIRRSLARADRLIGGEYRSFLAKKTL